MRSPICLLFLWALGQISVTTASPTQRIPIVKLQNGTLAGSHSRSYNQDFFLGVPYASPPLNELRLRKPTPPAAWTGIKTASSYGPWCIGNSIGLAGFSQNQTVTRSEDCLHLNLIRPGGTTTSAKLPVVAWIHGGGFDDGSANDARQNGSFLVQTSVDMGSPIIFISFNFRLGLFGTMSGSAIEEAGLTNLMLHDQRQALVWIQENVARFGGDASRVTIMGESAGAMSVGFHLVAYGGRNDGLFSAAIAQSGGPFSVNPALRNATQREADFQNVLKITGCTDVDDHLDCLRAVPADSLRAASLQVPRYFTIDGDFLPEDNVRLLREGRFVKVPLLVGSTRNEGTSFVQQIMSSPLGGPPDFASFVRAVWGAGPVPGSVLEAWTRLYQEEIDSPSPAGLGTVAADLGPEYGPEYGKKSLWMGDIMFTAGRRITNQAWAANGVPSYSFLFDTVPANANATTLGAAHFLETPYMFANLQGVGWEEDPFPNEPRLKKKHEELAKVMSRMWVSFVVKGSPNFHKASSIKFKWPVYSKAAPTNIVFSATKGSHLQPDTWRTEAIDIINKLRNDSAD